jgi:hypothetical protein
MSGGVRFSASRMFPHSTGCGVRVAVVDTGINAAHSHVQRVAGGVHIRIAADGGASFADQFQDCIGHGTAVAGVIRAYAPNAELYAVKVFEGRLVAHAKAVAEGIRWAARQRMDVINLSLGTWNAAHGDLLRAACAAAQSSEAIIVAAAADGQAGNFFPASLPDVIAVAGDEQLEWGEYQEGDRSCCLRAHPSPRPLPGRPPWRNLHGNSFATAQISGLAARVRQIEPQATPARMLDLLLQPRVCAPARAR